MAELDPFLDHVMPLIRRSGAFPGVNDDGIRSIAAGASWFSIPGGNTLFRQGDPADAIYIAVSGLFGVSVRTAAGDDVLISRIGPGEVIGEMGCVLDEPRAATVHALRTSELLMLTREALTALSRTHPAILLSLYRTVATRLRTLQEGRVASYQPRTFCLLPCLEDDVALAFAHDLTAQLTALGPTFLVSKREFADATADRFGRLESTHTFGVYVAERGQTPWSRLCLRQADVILVVARGTDMATSVAALDKGAGCIPVELVLLWPGHIVPGKTAPWLDAVDPHGHFHVRERNDVGHAARLLTGRGLGLVLSGGGARGLSHAGVARALTDHGVAIDAICGTSIGALMGGAIAMEWDSETLRRYAREFSDRGLMWELVLPRWSLLSGRNLRQSAERWFGEWAIEETPLRYACVTTNLTTCTANIATRGKLKNWICASCSLPGIFPPVIAEDGIHVDGGVMNNLPTDVMRGMGVGFVVAVAVSALRNSVAVKGKKGAKPLPNIIDLLWQVGMIGGGAHSAAARSQCDVLLEPDVQHVGILEWRAYDDAFKRGYDCTVANIDRIQRRIADPADSLGLLQL